MNKHLPVASVQRHVIHRSCCHRGPGLLGSSQMAQPAEFLTHSMLEEAAFDKLPDTAQKPPVLPGFQDT